MRSGLVYETRASSSDSDLEELLPPIHGLEEELPPIHEFGGASSSDSWIGGGTSSDSWIWRIFFLRFMDLEELLPPIHGLEEELPPIHGLEEELPVHPKTLTNVIVLVFSGFSTLHGLLQVLGHRKPEKTHQF